MVQIKLSKAKEKDISIIAELAERIWNQYYTSIISIKQINYMLKMMYSKKSLTEQIKLKKHIFYLISSSAKSVGFLSVHKTHKDNWFLHKFYIDQNKAGKGVGTFAFKKLIETIKPQIVTLTVNRRNFKSINFYFKLGFVIKNTANFDIGKGFVMNDFVMEWKK